MTLAAVTLASVTLLVPLLVSTARAQTASGYDLTWSTIDAGGGTFSAGSGFTVGGTIGQPDAGTHSGAGFMLIGGFWAALAELPPPCVGDCDHNGKVTVNEIIAGVNIALGSLTLDHCPSFDVTNDSMVKINEIIIAVNNAVGSCPQG